MKICLIFLIIAISIAAKIQDKWIDNFLNIKPNVYQVVVFINGIKNPYQGNLTIQKHPYERNLTNQKHSYERNLTIQNHAYEKNVDNHNYEKNDPYEIIVNFLQKAMNSFPIRLITINEELIKDAEKLIESQFLSPQTSIFVLVNVANEQNNLDKINDFLTELCQNRKKPKYLLIVKKTPAAYEELRRLWSKGFLDATILETGKSSKTKGREEATIIKLNPFSNTLRIEKNGVLFPEKLRNLHGYQMIISFTNRAPEVIIDYNQTPYKISGIMYQKLKVLANAMNFQIKIPNIRNPGNFSCVKNEASDETLALRYGKVHLIAIEFGRYESCENNLYEWSKGVGNANIVLVVPIVIINSKTKITPKILNGIILLTVPLLLSILSRILNFDKWKIEYMLQIMLGLVSPQEPKREWEKVFFTAILWASFFFSSYIYMTLTSVHVYQEQKEQFETIDDVVKSEISVKIESLYYLLTYKSSENMIRKLLDRSVHLNVDGWQCLDDLVAYKNVTCIVKEELAWRHLGLQGNNDGVPVAKIIGQQINYMPSHTVLEPGSPFVSRFDELIQRIHEAGIVGKWWNEYSFEGSSIMTKFDARIATEDLKDKVIKNVFLFFSLGYVISIIAFLLELIAFYLNRNVLV